MRLFFAATLVALSPIAATAATYDETKLTASDGTSLDQFGISVAIFDATAIVGARYDNDGDAGFNSGSAYLFDTTTGMQTAKLTADDAAVGDRFGSAVAIFGDRAIVGAPFDDDSGAESGSAYLFDTTTGMQTAKLTADDAAVRDRFGEAVAISRGRAFVGAPFDNNRRGSVYLFDTETGDQIAKLTASDAQANDAFGFSVGLSGTRALVGAFESNGRVQATGAAYFYTPADVAAPPVPLPAVPLPAGIWLLGTALGGLAAGRRACSRQACSRRTCGRQARGRAA